MRHFLLLVFFLIPLIVFGKSLPFDEKSGSKRISVSLNEVGSGFQQPLDLQFPPKMNRWMVVLEKEGKLKWLDLKTKKSGLIHRFQVLTRSEMGLLGMAFHPDFKKNRKVYFNMNPTGPKGQITEISEWVLEKGEGKVPFGKLHQKRVLITVPQPYPNHNAGQLSFGPDGYLYIGLGDGGYRDDPHNNAQNRSTLLGSLLRIDVNHTSPSRPYSIPKDNPFQNNKEDRPEIFAYGLRNPWKFSFNQDGNVIVADVGQDTWEEITLVKKGTNHGWKIKEATHCFSPEKNCPETGLVDPQVEYDHTVGASITGGYLYRGNDIPSLRHLYVFGDYISGRLWAVNLSKDNQKGRLKTPLSLGITGFPLATFGQNSQGDLFLADFAEGKVYQLSKGSSP